MEFSKEQWRGLKAHAESFGLIFLSSPFSIKAVELLTDLKITGWKIASGELGNSMMLESVAATGLPVILSTGMSNTREIDSTVSMFKASNKQLAIMQCTSAYPTPAEQVGLNVIGDLRKKYDLPVGLSDHSGTIFPSLSAVTLGASLIEVHVALSKECFGPDISASITTEELRTLVNGVRFIDKMLSSPVDKDVWSAENATLKQTFGRSIVAVQEIQAGQRVTKEAVALKKPARGLPPSYLPKLIGALALRNIEPGHFLKLQMWRWKYIENASLCSNYCSAFLQSRQDGT